MKSLCKRLLCLCLALLLLPAFPAEAVETATEVAGGRCGDNATWSLDTNGTLTVSGSGAMKDYTYQLDLGSTAPWNRYREQIRNVVIQEGITSISRAAFSAYTNLTTVTIPESVTHIGIEAFARCTKLTDLTIPEGVTSIGDTAFYNCNGLTNLTLPESLTHIGNYTFHSCHGLTNLTLPESLTRIGDCTFEYCTSLTDLTLPESLTHIGIFAFYGCDSLTNLTLPESLTRIGDSAFEYCTSLTDLTLPESLTHIGSFAFYGCDSLTDLTIPEGVTSIGKQTFAQCRNLKELTFLGHAPFFGEDCFKYVTATVSYPCTDSSWTADLMQNYGGNITWEALHLYGAGVPGQSATCTQDATELRTCSLCGTTTPHILPGTATGHHGETVTIPATCTEAGCTVLICTTCNETIVTDIPATGHTFQEGIWVTEPTCQEEGQKSYTCSDCGFIQYTTFPTTEHPFGEGVWVTQPTCQEEGQKSYTCSDCGFIKYATFPTVAHSEIIDPAVPATCTDTGLTEGTHCGTCGEILTAQEVVPATGHSFQKGVWVTQPTCQEKGQKSYTCSSCGFTKYATFPTVAHSEIIDPAVSATCTATGLTEGKHCGTCGEVLTAQEVVPAIGHRYETVMEAPTCTKDGTTTSTCAVCGDVLVGTIPATGHRFQGGSCIHCGEPDAHFLLGDVTGDGKVNMADVARLFAHARNKNKLTDKTALDCADVTGDGQINIADVARLFAHTRGTSPLS